MREPARVLLVDDSRIYRAALEEALREFDDVVVCDSVWSGEKALEIIRRDPPDLVTLDVEMPGMDGLATLRAIQEFNASRPREQQVGVLMVSAHTCRGAEATIQALQAGAFDFIEKPREASTELNVQRLRQHLTAKIRLFMQQRRGRRPPPVPAPPPRPARPGTGRNVRAVVMATSTGGPAALVQLVPELCRSVDQPVLIVQHILAGFTAALAESLARHAGRPVVEGVHGDLVRPQTVYLAPAGQHMLVRAGEGGVRIVLNQQPPENGCRPAADVLFRSAAAVYGGDLVAVVLTGMLDDGARGIEPIKRAGGHVLVQDEASSVVWGMPANALATNCVDEVVPLGQMAARIAALCRKQPA
jgi:two-component system, chemotaxis family, protein-glutamate methylesterase/glutaminase